MTTTSGGPLPAEWSAWKDGFEPEWSCLRLSSGAMQLVGLFKPARRTPAGSSSAATRAAVPRRTRASRPPASPAHRRSQAPGDVEALRPQPGIEGVDVGVVRGCAVPWWASPLGVEGPVRNPNTPGGHHGGEANPAELHAGVHGAGGRAAAGGRPRAVGGGDRARAEHGAAEHLAERAAGGRIGRGLGSAQGRGSGGAAAQAREQAAGGGEPDPARGRAAVFAKGIA